MAKDITITNVDGLNLADKSNMNNSSRKKIKTLHEQLFNQYGIDPEKVYEKTGILKTIPLEWIQDIIIKNISSCKTARDTENINKSDKVISLNFTDPETCEAFYKEFNMNMNKIINIFIKSKNEDPQRYNRILVIETTLDNSQITIRY